MEIQFGYGRTSRMGKFSCEEQGNAAIRHRAQNQLRQWSVASDAYRLWVPGQICERLCDLRDQVKDQDDDHDERADQPPGHLPEDVGLVAYHELDIFVEPMRKQ